MFLETPEEMQEETKEPLEETKEPQGEMKETFEVYHNVNVSSVPELNAKRYFSDDEDLDIVLLLGDDTRLIDMMGKQYIQSKLVSDGTGPPPLIRQANWIAWHAEAEQQSNILIIRSHVNYELHLKIQV